MSRSLLFLFALTLGGCPTAEKADDTGTGDTSDTDADADSDTDTDTDTDSDTDTDTDTDSDTAPPVDADGDGFNDDVDCDDSNDTVYPGATEVLDDGIDQDCDGSDASAFLRVADMVAGDLVITEYMANPAAVSDTDGEWFEVWNVSGQDANLDGLVVSDRGTDSFTVSGALLVGAGEAVVFGAEGDTALNGGVAVDYVWPSYTLGNDDDEIVLSNGRTEIDVVAYGTSGWVDPNGASASLDPSYTNATDNDDAAFWCESSSTFGAGDAGTPGTVNDTCSDVEPVDNDGDGYTSDVDCDDADPGINPGAEDIEDDGIDQDCDGVDATSGSTGADSLRPGDLVITEVMQNPAVVGDSDGEWFEVYVTRSTSVDLAGLVVTDADGNSFTVSTLTANPGDYLVFAVNADSATNGGVTVSYDYPSSFTLGNDSESITLARPDGTVVDTVAWDNGVTFPDPDGASMELGSSSFDATSNDLGANWCEADVAFGSGDLGTPGLPNRSCGSTTDADGDGWFSDVDCDDADATINPGATDTADDGLDQNCDGADGYAGTVLTVDDVGVGQLLITEFLQNPDATSDADGEWFEIYVSTSDPVDLDGLVVSDDGGDSFTVTGSLVVYPGDYVVFAIEGDTTLNGEVAADYVYTGFTLANDSDEIVLSNASGEIDRVAYDNGATFPDPTGATSQLSADTFDSVANDDGGNWCEPPGPWSSSGSGDLGSPGTANVRCGVSGDTDADGDGYLSDLDCDDTDPTVHPLATETDGDGVDSDCDGNDDNPVATALPIALAPTGTIFVTEIMADPDAVTDANGEWFEIYNSSGNQWDLDGLVISDLGTNSFTVSGSLVVDSNSFVVFGVNADTATNGGVAVDYVFNASSFALANSDDEIIMSTATGVMDSVYYDGGVLFPDPTGASMSLRPTTFNATSNDDGSNWCTATMPWASGDAGSPGTSNEPC
jgi:hypothetical protein